MRPENGLTGFEVHIILPLQTGHFQIKILPCFLVKGYSQTLNHGGTNLKEIKVIFVTSFYTAVLKMQCPKRWEWDRK